MRPNLAGVLLTVSALLITSTVSAAFSDTQHHPYRAAIDELVRRGIVQGYADGTYKPDALINRAEFLKILIESRFPSYQPKDLRCFYDVHSPVPVWYSRPVCAGKELGIVQGYPDGTFRPDRAVNLVEALKMAFLSFSISPAASQGEWYQKYLNAASSRGILLHRLQTPDHLITRGEMASIAYTLLGGSAGSASSGGAVCGNGIKEGAEQCDDGNALDGDGCSSICVIVPEPVRLAMLQIDQQASGTVTGTTAGKQDVTLLKFTAVAGRQPVLLTRVVFRAATGSLLYGQNYELLVDSNNDGIYELVHTAAKAQGSVLSFQNFTVGGVYVPLGTTMPFLVRADIPGSAGSVQLGLAFATELVDYVEARGYEDGIELEGIETNGVCSRNCFIRVNTQGGTTVSVSERGSLFISQDTTPVRSTMMIAGSVSRPLLRLRLRSVREEIDLSFLAIEGVSPTVDALRLHLINPGDSTETLPAAVASATRSQCSSVSATRVCVRLPTRTIVISPSAEKVLVVTAATLNDQLGGESGKTVALKLNATNGSLHAAEAYGVSSNKVLEQNDNDSTDDGEIFIGRTTVGGNATITGPTHDTAFAGIAKVENAGPDSSPSIPSGLHTVGTFRVTAHTHNNAQGGVNDVAITKFTFSVSAQNVEIETGSFRLRNVIDPGSTAQCSNSGVSGTITVTCGSLSGIASDLGPGEAFIFELLTNVTNTQVSSGSASLQTTLPTLGLRSATNSILWSDEDTAFSWVDIPETSISSTLYYR